uniref:CMP-sialic acid transporter n=1 Tax=Coccolithus braarudii TaxID=221442 RepID=A0A7S0L5G4_9EUKA|mmetsp:Transcript_21582/g.46474  ORF Transcript_21582/g.46474 Transcript_21582/m.46474 type:complete len:357 (+) Transcript_21582:95-1165(+)
MVNMFEPKQLPFTCAAALFMSLQPILVTLSKNEAGRFDYSVPASTMLSEMLKLGISATLLCRHRLTSNAALLSDDSVAEFFSYMLPALIYFVNNNCLFFILQAVDPTTFQLLSQLKTIFTGLLFRLCLNRRLSAVQYLALVTLACGTAVSQIPSAATNDPVSHRHSHAVAAAAGVALSVLSCALSALGGVYSEKLLKGRPTASIHWQNIQLYIWGVVFNALGTYLKDREALVSRGLLAGFDRRAGTVVMCNALNGLAISAVLKYADNIARVYAHAIAMMATMLACVQLFDAPVTPQLVLAVILVATSTFQYNLPPSLLKPPSSPLGDGAEDSDDSVSAKLIRTNVIGADEDKADCS